MDYVALKEKVMSWIANIVTTSSGPAPMDRGESTTETLQNKATRRTRLDGARSDAITFKP